MNQKRPNAPIEEATVSVNDVRMGTPQSKTDTSGDALVQVVNNQDLHTSYHEEHSVILWVICVVVAISLVLELEKRYKSAKTRDAERTARSIARLTDVIAEK